MTRPITRRVSTYRLPKPCSLCLGDVYIGVEGYNGAVCIDCKHQPTAKKPEPAPAGLAECPSCGVICAEGVEH